MGTTAGRIGNNPLDRVGGGVGKTHALDAWLDVKPTKPKTPKPDLEPRRERISVRIPVDLANEIRDAIVQIGGPLQLTLDGFATKAMQAELERLKVAYNDGKPFEKRPVQTLRPGRRIWAIEAPKQALR